MDAILKEIESADGIVLGSPVNAGTVTAVMKKFTERLICYTYWPWGANAPVKRTKTGGKKALLVASSAAPQLVARLSTNVVKLMKEAAELLGARVIGTCFIGLAAREKNQDIGEKNREKSRLLAGKLIPSL